jgi:hypothetical protein
VVRPKLPVSAALAVAPKSATVDSNTPARLVESGTLYNKDPDSKADGFLEADTQFTRFQSCLRWNPSNPTQIDVIRTARYVLTISCGYPWQMDVSPVGVEGAAIPLWNWEKSNNYYNNIATYEFGILADLKAGDRYWLRPSKRGSVSAHSMYAMFSFKRLPDPIKLETNPLFSLPTGAPPPPQPQREPIVKTIQPTPSNNRVIRSTGATLPINAPRTPATIRSNPNSAASQPATQTSIRSNPNPSPVHPAVQTSAPPSPQVIVQPSPPPVVKQAVGSIPIRQLSSSQSLKPVTIVNPNAPAIVASRPSIAAAPNNGPSTTPAITTTAPNSTGSSPGKNTPASAGLHRVTRTSSNAANPVTAPLSQATPSQQAPPHQPSSQQPQLPQTAQSQSSAATPGTSPSNYRSARPIPASSRTQKAPTVPVNGATQPSISARTNVRS